jgi:hypothetical protein
MVEKAMTLLTHQGEGPAFPYAGQPMHILAGHGGWPPGFAAMEITVPGRFAGPIPRARRIRRGNLRAQRTAAGRR